MEMLQLFNLLSVKMGLSLFCYPKTMVSPQQKPLNAVSDLCGTRKLQGHIQELPKSLLDDFFWKGDGVSQLHPWRGQTKDNKPKYKPSAPVFAFTYYLLLGKKKNWSYVWEHTEMAFKIRFLVLCQSVPYMTLINPSFPLCSCSICTICIKDALVYSGAFNYI